MDWENDPGVTEEAVKAVKEARDRADAFHEQSRLDEWMKEALREVLGKRHLPANPYHALAEHFRTIEIRSEMERGLPREGPLLQTLINELSLPDESTGLARLRSGGPWCARPHVLRGVHAPSLETLVGALRHGPRFLLKHYEDTVDTEGCKIRTVSALLNGSAFVGRLVPRLQELEVSHVFMAHGPKPEKALNACGRLLLQALLDSTADTRVVDATLTLEASGRTAAQHWHMDAIVSEGAHGRFVRDVKGAMVGRRAVTLRCWCWLRLPFHSQPQFTPLRVRFALIFSPTSAASSFKVMEPHPGELLALGVFLDARRAATYATATATATSAAAADEGKSTSEEEARVALALRVARGLRRGHVDRVHAGIAALVLMKRGDEGALAGVYALTHSTAGEVAGVVAAARALADVLAALRKGPLGRLREAQEEMLRPSWVVAKSVAAEATRPRPEYGQHRAAPAQEGAGQAPTAADAAEDRVRVMNSLLQQQFRLVLVRTMTIAKTARSSHVVSAWPALQRALTGLRDPVTGALLVNARAPRAARVVEALLQNSARLAFRDAMDAALLRYEPLARVLRGVADELGGLLEPPNLAFPLASLASPPARGRRQGSRVGGDRPRSRMSTAGSSAGAAPARASVTAAQAAEAAAAALRAVGERMRGSEGARRRSQDAGEVQSAPPRLVAVAPLAVEAAMRAVSELLARPPAAVFAGGDNGEGAHAAVEVATEARRAVAMGKVPETVAREGAVARTAVAMGLHACLAECASAAVHGRRHVRPLPRVVGTLYRWGGLLERSRRMQPAHLRLLRGGRRVARVPAAPWVWRAAEAGSGDEAAVFGTRSAVSHCAIGSARGWLDHLEASGDVASLPAEARAGADLQVSSFLLGEAAFHGALTQPRGCSAHSVLAYHEHAVRAPTEEAVMRTAARAIVHRARRLVASLHHASVYIVAGNYLGVTPTGWGGVPDAIALSLGALAASREASGGGAHGARGGHGGGFGSVLETGTVALVTGMGPEGMLETPGPAGHPRASPSLRFLDHAAAVGREAARRRKEAQGEQGKGEQGKGGRRQGAAGRDAGPVNLCEHRWAAHNWDPLAPPPLGSSDDAPRPLRQEWFHDRRAQRQAQARTYAACARGDVLGGLGQWHAYDEVRLMRDETGVATEVERALRTGLSVAVFSLAKPPPPPAGGSGSDAHTEARGRGAGGGARAASSADGPLSSLHPLVPVLELCGAAQVTLQGRLQSSHSGPIIRAAARLCGVARRREDALQLARGWSFQELNTSLRVTANMGSYLHDTATAAAHDMLGGSDGPQPAENEAELAQRIALTSVALSAEAAAADAGNAYRAAAQRVGAVLLCGGDEALAEACAELDGSALAARRARTVLVSLLAMQLAGTAPPEGALIGQAAGLVSTVMHAVTHPESARSRGGAAVVAAELADVVDDLSLDGGAASDRELVGDCTDLSLILVGMEATSGALRAGGDPGEDVAGV